ncbi:MAG TPA: UrcA family protein [Rhizomicrobium sp.]|nr:UrcA family protein [Rhizomicrobium sp.]
MNIYSNARQHVAYAALAAFGVIALSNIAIAQTTPESSAPTAAPTNQATEVTVTAPREVTRTRVGRSNIGAPIEDVAVTERVNIQDLDLKKTADVDELNRRVREAAADSCSELDRLFPLVPSSQTRRDCIRRAMRGANAQIEAAVAASGGRYGGNAEQP